jgi:hypothetical protein
MLYQLEIKQLWNCVTVPRSAEAKPAATCGLELLEFGIVVHAWLRSARAARFQLPHGERKLSCNSSTFTLLRKKATASASPCAAASVMIAMIAFFVRCSDAAGALTDDDCR